VEDLGGGVTLEMVEIPAGKFTMGSPGNEADRSSDEGPQHQVSVPSFYIGKFEVTQAQWRAVAGLPKDQTDLNPDPSYFKGNDRPVENVSWWEAMEFCTRLSRKTGKTYRLPTEAEWEYACRAVTTTPFAFGDTITPDIVNYDGNYPYASAAKGTYRQSTVDVGSLGVANGFGLYDMHGNVWEWCMDNWHGNYDGAPRDGSEWKGGDSSYRVLRGGSWGYYGDSCRAANRNWYTPALRVNFIGFRLVLIARTR
jgi:formylglycine-generating enzyme required for sulfatase activity